MSTIDDIRRLKVKGDALNIKVQDLVKCISLVVFIPPTISRFGKIISTNLSHVCF